MRAVIQRCHQARVEVDGAVVGEVGSGLAIFLGVRVGDDEECARRLARKIAGLRIFDDAAGRFALSLLDCRGEALVISNFTVYADSRKGTRPNFGAAAPSERARELYLLFVTLLREVGVATESGEFGAAMRVTVDNDGPVTLCLDADAVTVSQ